MANEKMISPGVFTREKDQSFLATGVGAIGAVIIGPTEKGQAFMPTPITNANEFDNLFGGNSDKTYVPFVVKDYLRNAGIVHVVRVMGVEGWNETTTRSVGQNDSIIITSHTSSGAVPIVLPLAILVPTSGSAQLTDTSMTASGFSASAFYLTSSLGMVSCSFDRGSPNYITKVFGTDPAARVGNALSKEWYVYALFPEIAQTASNFPLASHSLTTTESNMTFVSNKDYSPAYTPWIQSQNSIAGGPFNLFRFITIGEGTAMNKAYKIEISDIDKPAIGSDDYTTFNVSIRNFGDLDTRQEVLETFENCNLDPNSRNYILKRIGDKYTTIDSSGRINTFGDYDRVSKYVRVEASPGLDTLDNTIAPFGHYGYLYISAIPSGSVPFKGYQGTQTTYNSVVPWGINLDHPDAAPYIAPIMDSTVVINSSIFNLDNQFGHPYSTTAFGSPATVSQSLSASDAPIEMLKFTVCFQKGWDGMPPNRGISVGGGITAANVFGFDLSSAATSGSVAYKKAINAISNADEFDLNMIVIPGIMEYYHPWVTDAARNLCSIRGDCFYLMDCVGLNDTKEQAEAAVDGIDDNYTATYYPWVQIEDNTRDKRIWVPPSVVLPGVISFNDRISAPWYAPAGLNRGGLTQVVEVKRRLTQSDRNYLYENRINPIAMFPSVGPAVWGQKTLQKKASALDRVNVRRLLIEIEKFISSTSRYLVFEPNTNQTRQQFLAIVNPYLESVQRRSGVYSFRVVMDETINTPDVIDRNILKGEIYIQPTRAAEFIELTFNVMPTGGAFTTTTVTA